MNVRKRVVGWALAGSMAALALLLAPPLRSPVRGDGGGGLLQGSALKANLDLPYNAGGEAAEEESIPEVLVFYGKTYEASAVCFALDESGSMKEQGRWELQTREVTTAIAELSEEADFGIVYYGSRVSAFRNSPVPATGNNKAAGLVFVRSRRPAGDTCVGEGVVKALQIVRQSRHKHRAVIVTSDGRPDNCATGNRATPQEVQMIYEQTLAANADRSAKVHTVWVGQGQDKQAMEFLRRLAQIHGGTFRAVSR